MEDKQKLTEVSTSIKYIEETVGEIKTKFDGLDNRYSSKWVEHFVISVIILIVIGAIGYVADSALRKSIKRIEHTVSKPPVENSTRYELF